MKTANSHGGAVESTAFDCKDIRLVSEAHAQKRRSVFSINEVAHCARELCTGVFAHSHYIALTISSTIFLASENNIMVLSRKNSSLSTPA